MTEKAEMYENALENLKTYVQERKINVCER